MCISVYVYSYVCWLKREVELAVQRAYTPDVCRYRRAGGHGGSVISSLGHPLPSPPTTALAFPSPAHACKDPVPCCLPVAPWDPVTVASSVQVSQAGLWAARTFQPISNIPKDRRQRLTLGHHEPAHRWAANPRGIPRVPSAFCLHRWWVWQHLSF